MCKDIKDVAPEEVEEEFIPDTPRILVGCAPCQPFSKYTQAREDPKWRLLDDFAALITKVRPDVVSMENVPQLVHFKGGELFGSLHPTFAAGWIRNCLGNRLLSELWSSAKPLPSRGHCIASWKTDVAGIDP